MGGFRQVVEICPTELGAVEGGAVGCFVGGLLGGAAACVLSGCTVPGVVFGAMLGCMVGDYIEQGISK